LNRRIRDDPPYQACSVQSAQTRVRGRSSNAYVGKVRT
jgi:hypothetical protein